MSEIVNFSACRVNVVLIKGFQFYPGAAADDFRFVIKEVSA